MKRQALSQELHAVDIRPDMSAIVLEFVKDSLSFLSRMSGNFKVPGA